MKIIQRHFPRFSAIILIASWAFTGCSQFATKKKSYTSPQEYAPDSLLLKDGNAFLFDVAENFSFAIPLQKGISRNDCQFSMKCLSEDCPSELALTAEGKLSWTPGQTLRQLDDYKSFMIRLSVTDFYSNMDSDEKSIVLTAGSPKENTWQAEAISTEKAERLDLNLQKLVRAVGQRSFQVRGLDENNKPVTRIQSKSGTVFYLGAFKGRHFISSAKHVFGFLDNETDLNISINKVNQACNNGYGGYAQFDFPLASVAAKCERVIWVSDYSLDSIIAEVTFSTTEDAAKMEPGALSFGSGKSLELNALLATAGFGGVRNPYYSVTLKIGDNCRLYSTEPKLRKDQKGQIWLLPNGCSTTLGDSGSPMISRNSDQVIGIMSRGKLERAISPEDYVFTKENMGTAFDKNVESFVPIDLIKNAVMSAISQNQVNLNDVEALKWVFRHFNVEEIPSNPNQT